MAVLHAAQLSPSKLGLLSAWAPTQPWLGRVQVGTLRVAGAFRFDDPEGEVGIEAFLLETAGGDLLHVPVTYRGSPFAGADDALIGTTEHSVLGRRWVYDGCADPVYVAVVLTTMFTGGAEADLELVTETGHVERPKTAWARGSGAPGATVPTFSELSWADKPGQTVTRAGNVEVTVRRLVSGPYAPDVDGAAAVLRGTWAGQDAPVVLASVRRLA